MNKIIILVMMLTIAGCASVASVNRPVDYYQPGNSNSNEAQLFSSSDSNLSESAICNSCKSTAITYDIELTGDILSEIEKFMEKSNTNSPDGTE